MARTQKNKATSFHLGTHKKKHKTSDIVKNVTPVDVAAYTENRAVKGKTRKAEERVINSE
jgi:hypothetical protein